MGGKWVKTGLSTPGVMLAATKPPVILHLCLQKHRDYKWSRDHAWIFIWVLGICTSQEDVLPTETSL